MCDVKNEKTGDTASVPCSSITMENDTIVEQLEAMNGTDNGTLHCSKTKYGCCPDWYTVADDPNGAGCPSFVLGETHVIAGSYICSGVCNETQYGCCPDGVTLARSANFEGCGEASCAASRFGCCKDRKTIAFGPHYLGEFMP
jgi:hypothetical protein